MTISVIDTSQIYTGQASAYPGSAYGGDAPDDMKQWASRTVEKVRAAVAGGLRFLPRLDNYTQETSEIRAAYRLMLREPVLKSAHKTKVEAVAQLDWQVHPVDPSDERDVEVAAFVKYCGKKIRGGTVGIARRVLGGALLDGFSVSNKVFDEQPIASGQFKGKTKWKYLKAKDTENLTLSTDEFRNITAIRPTAYGIGEAFLPEQFAIYSYGSLFESALGTSDHRAAYGSFWFKNTIKQLWGLHLDKYVSPLLRGTYADTSQKAVLEAALEQARANTWISLPQGVVVEAIMLATRGEAEFEAACDYQDRQMLIATAGAYLQVLEGKISDGRGDTSIHRDASALFQWGLAADLTTIINEQMVPELVELNYAGAEPPEVTLGSISDSELSSSLAIDEGLQRLGFRHSRKAVAKFYSREEATDPDDVLAPAGQAQPEPQPQPLGGGLDALFGAPQKGGEPPALPFSEIDLFAEGESFFATCDRDDKGQCLPGSGEKAAGAGKPARSKMSTQAAKRFWKTSPEQPRTLTVRFRSESEPQQVEAKRLDDTHSLVMHDGMISRVETAKLEKAAEAHVANSQREAQRAEVEKQKDAAYAAKEKVRQEKEAKKEAAHQKKADEVRKTIDPKLSAGIKRATAVRTREEHIVFMLGAELKMPEAAAKEILQKMVFVGDLAEISSGGKVYYQSGDTSKFAEGESFFATCDRDELGHCIGEGGIDNDPGAARVGPAKVESGGDRAIAAGKKIAAYLDAHSNQPIVRQAKAAIGKALRWVAGKQKALSAAMTARYGKAVSTSVFLAAQAVGGNPLIVPGWFAAIPGATLLAQIPMALATAATIELGRGAVAGAKAAGKAIGFEEELTDEEIAALGQKVADHLSKAFFDALESDRDTLAEAMDEFEE